MPNTVTQPTTHTRIGTDVHTPLSRRRLLQSTLPLSLAALLPTAFTPTASAQRSTPSAPVPFYTPAHVVQAVYAYWLLPRSQRFMQSAQALHHSLTQPNNSRQKQKRAWIDAMGAWEQLSTIAIGPLLQHRSIRSIDFTPTRPRLIRRALANTPQNMDDMELVGAPARGLPALEWLLWQQPEQTDSNNKISSVIGYSQLLSEDILLHAHQLTKTTQQMAAKPWEGEDAKAAFSELINQWLGAIERLRWSKLQKPLMQKTQGSTKAQYPREASQQSGASWLRQWQAIYQMAGFDATPNATVPSLNDGKPSGLITLETYLRGLGDNPLADKLTGQLQQCNTAMQALAPLQPTLPSNPSPSPAATDAITTATKQLESLQRLTEHQLATAMRVSIGFSDADGD